MSYVGSAMRRAVRIRPLSLIAPVAIAVGVALAPLASAVAVPQDSQLEQEIRDYVVRTLGSLQHRLICPNGQSDNCLEFDKLRRNRAIAGCFAASVTGDVSLLSVGSAWNWRRSDQAEEAALFHCEKNRANNGVECECTLVSVNNESVFKVSQSLIKEVKTKRELAAARWSPSPAPTNEPTPSEGASAQAGGKSEPDTQGDRGKPSGTEAQPSKQEAQVAAAQPEAKGSPEPAREMTPNETVGVTKAERPTDAGNETPPESGQIPSETESQALALQRTDEEVRRLEALVKELQQNARLTEAPDTDLPMIRVKAPERVAVGDRVQVGGLVGDSSTPPRLKVNGKPAILFRLQADQEPIAKHTLAFAIDVDTTAVGPRSYVLEACDAAGNCVGEHLELKVVAANRPSLTARNYALIIGNNEYRTLPRLRTSIADAKAIAGVLTDRYAFDQANVFLLLDATRSAILDELDVIRRLVGPEDRLFLYYAGHGVLDPFTEAGFWQPIDALPDKRYSWISNDDIRLELRGIPARHILVVADSCFSGSLVRGIQNAAGVPEERFYAEIDRPVSRKVISSGGTEPVADSGTAGHSIFAYYLLKALKENDRPYLVSFELFNKLARAVTNNSNQRPQYGVISRAGDEGSGDFTFVLRQ